MLISVLISFIVVIMLLMIGMCSLVFRFLYRLVMLV